MATSSAGTKPKAFYQTKLCFGRATASSDKKLDQQRSGQRQLQIIDGNASLKKSSSQAKCYHPPPCPPEKCDLAIRRVPCTSVNPKTRRKCDYKFCISCLDAIYGEKVCETQLCSWICPICRGTCVCDECKRPKNNLTSDIREKMQLSFRKAEPIDPPKMRPITLLYSEEELWIRLQIREFVFHFGRYFGLDDIRFTSNLQNVQGKWRTKRLASHIAVQLIRRAKESMLDVFGKAEHNAYISQLGNQMFRSWCEYYEISEDGGLESIVETEGLNTTQWDDIIELLNAADFTVPIIQGRRTALHELQLVQLMCDMLLLDSSLRKSLMEENKDLKAKEATLRKERADLEVEQLTAKRRKIDDPKEAQTLDAQLRRDRVALEQKRLCYMMDVLRSSKRIAPSWRDNDGNEYWIFNDLVGCNNGSDSTRNSEPYWAFGVIVIGQGGWFYIHGEQELMQLRRWADSASTFKTQLTNRLQYLATLENLSQM